METGAAADSRQTVLNYFGGDFNRFYQKHIPNLKKIKGDEWAAACPFHQDTEPSLNFNAQTGRFYCHGCGAKGDIFSFHGRRHGLSNGDFPKVLEGIAGDFGITLPNGHQADPEPGKGGRIVATYDYLNANGTLLFQVCRQEPKTFRQRRPDGKGGWIWNLKGVEPILYNFTKIFKVGEVLFVEGEKDADALTERGFDATTNPMGAGKWRDSYTEALRGKDVILIPDNDEPGREHMRHIAGELHGKAKSIKILNLPGLPDKGDVSDFLALHENPEAGGEALYVLAHNAPVWDPREREDKPAENPLSDLLACAVTEEYCEMLGEEKWAFPNLLIKNQITVIIATTGGGKSTIFYNHICPWILRNQPETKILYLDCDSPASDHKKMKAHATQMGNRFQWLNPITHGKTAAFMIDELKKIAQKRHRLNNEVLIFDTLKKFLNLMDKRSAKPFFELMRGLTSLGATIALLGHANKYRNASGGLIFEGVGDIQNDADALLFFERMSAIDGLDVTTVVSPDKGAKVRGLFEPISFHITLPEREVTQHKTPVPVPNWGTPAKAGKKTYAEIEQMVKNFLAAQKGHKWQHEIVSEFKGVIPHNALFKVLTAVAVPEGESIGPGQIIYKTGFRNAKKYYTLSA